MGFSLLSLPLRQFLDEVCFRMVLDFSDKWMNEGNLMSFQKMYHKIPFPFEKVKSERILKINMAQRKQNYTGPKIIYFHLKNRRSVFHGLTCIWDSIKYLSLKDMFNELNFSNLYIFFIYQRICFKIGIVWCDNLHFKIILTTSLIFQN